jgi:hypothetical protein
MDMVAVCAGSPRTTARLAKFQVSLTCWFGGTPSASGTTNPLGGLVGSLRH